MAGEVHVYQLDLDKLRLFMPLLQKRISTEERERAARFRQSEDRDRFICSHGMLRTILAERTGDAPGELQFECGPHGKPALRGQWRLAFNISHAGAWALVAVSRDCDVGVDVEQVRPQPEVLGLAQRFFSAEEAAALHALSEEHQRTAFFWCWTRKEAYLKGIGTGIANELNQSPTPVMPGPLPEPFAIVPPWTLRDLSIAPGYVGAVAASTTYWQLRRTTISSVLML